MSRFLTTFPNGGEFEKACRQLDSARMPYEVVSPQPAYACVGTPSVAVEPEGRALLSTGDADGALCSGWVDYRPSEVKSLDSMPPGFPTDVFGRCAIMVLAPCVADDAKIRLVAHISGDLGPVMPYLNATMTGGLYSPDGPTFTFMEGPRMVSLYSRRITIAKADEITDAWRMLERIRVMTNEAWACRETIKPCYTTRHRPPALEVYKRLPGTNCRACGEMTCLAFAMRLWKGEGSPEKCTPVFGGSFGHLKPALLTICEGVGIDITGLASGAE